MSIPTYSTKALQSLSDIKLSCFSSMVGAW